MKASVSVVIPTYNSARFIRSTLTSVFEQVTPPLELIVVDDASTDDTLRIVASFVSHAPFPLRIIRLKSNTGSPVRPMNVGVTAANGKLFTILDHDDLLCPEAIREYWSAWEQFKDQRVGMVTSDLMTFNTAGIVYPSHFRQPTGLLSQWSGSFEQPVLFSASFARRMLCKSFCLPTKAAFSREAWCTLRGFTTRYRSAWDCDIVWRLTQRYAVVAIDQILVKVRMHSGCLSANQTPVTHELTRFYHSILRDIRDPELQSEVLRRQERELFDLAYGAYKSRNLVETLIAAIRLGITRLRRLCCCSAWIRSA